MPKPRVFVSSTYYDLKHIRSSIELFIETLGYDPVLSEKGDIAYVPDRPLDESCYREASAADIFVIILGGRYGSEASGMEKAPSRTFFERYESITRKEFEAAYAEDVPTYILIESGVYSEYQTYLRNKGNDTVKYAHVDSMNVFRLIEDILTKPRNNPLYAFDRSAQIELWLKDQWSGLFRELLKTRSQQKQLLALTGQVSELKAVNETLKNYLEAVMKGISVEDSSSLIESEERKLEEKKRAEVLRTNPWSDYITRSFDIELDFYIESIKLCKSAVDFADRIASKTGRSDAKSDILDILGRYKEARKDFNSARIAAGAKPFERRQFPPSKDDFDFTPDTTLPDGTELDQSAKDIEGE